MILENWRSFLPAIFAFLVGLLCIRMPAIAVFFVAGALFFFAFVYAFIVYRIIKGKQAMKAMQDQYAEAQARQYEAQQQADTSFRNVTVQMFKNGDWFEIKK